MGVTKQEMYWRANLKLLSICMVVWFCSAYLAGIVFVQELNQIEIGNRYSNLRLSYKIIV